MPTIKLQSSDGEDFPVDVEIARCSLTIKTMLEDLGMEDNEEETIPLPNVNSAILKKVLVWATHHKVCIMVLSVVVISGKTGSNNAREGRAHRRGYGIDVYHL